MKRNPKLEKIRRRTSDDVKLLIDHSFAIVDRINEILLEKRITQRDLAKKLGKRESEVSKWMRGTHNFTLKTIAKLESVLGEPIFRAGSQEPGIFVMQIKNDKGFSLAVRGERRSSGDTKLLYETSETSFIVNELVEQYN